MNTPKLIQAEVVELLNDLLVAENRARDAIQDCTNQAQWDDFRRKRTNLLIDCAEKVQEFYDKRADESHSPTAWQRQARAAVQPLINQIEQETAT